MNNRQIRSAARDAFLARRSSALPSPSAFAVGDHVIDSTYVATGCPHYKISYAQGANWPASGDVLTLLLETRPDDKSAWSFDASFTLPGGLWKNRQKQLVIAGDVTITIPAKTGAHELRLTVQAHWACSAAIKLSLAS